MTTILLVGGDTDLSSDMMELLEYEGFQTVGAPASAIEALTYAARTQPDLIIVISTRGLDNAEGVDTVRALRHNAPDSRVIVWSARDSVTYIEQMLGLGIFAYVPKPVTYQELLDAVRAVAAGRRLGYVAHRMAV